MSTLSQKIPKELLNKGEVCFLKLKGALRSLLLLYIFNNVSNQALAQHRVFGSLVAPRSTHIADFSFII